MRGKRKSSCTSEHFFPACRPNYDSRARRTWADTSAAPIAVARPYVCAPRVLHGVSHAAGQPQLWPRVHCATRRGSPSCGAATCAPRHTAGQPQLWRSHVCTAPHGRAAPAVAGHVCTHLQRVVQLILLHHPLVRGAALQHVDEVRVLAWHSPTPPGYRLVLEYPFSTPFTNTKGYLRVLKGARTARRNGEYGTAVSGRHSMKWHWCQHWCAGPLASSRAGVPD